MWKIIKIFCTIIITSFFFFPFSFTFLPTVNTKMFLALIGLILLVLRLGVRRTSKIDKDFFVLTLFALGVSFASFLSMTINSTSDGLYLTYVISMWVWLGAAYFVVSCIRNVHGKVSVELVGYYLIAVGVCQCFLAIAIDNIPFVKGVVDSFLEGEGFMGKNEGRLYGVGCALDVAGGRFAALLIIISCLIISPHRRISRRRDLMLWASFAVIISIGNMIGRTTSVGMIISIFYLIITALLRYENGGRRVLQWFFSVACIALMLCMVLYNSSDIWRHNLRFGFEGFFSLVEKGRWEVHSNEMLMDGFVFPDNTQTWLIGDGYMDDPDNDPYYIGESSWGFYKNTDVGYSRFIFYFGLLGLGAFSLFMTKASLICARRFNSYQPMFLLLLLLNFIIWLKASTDIFLVFAIFLCITYDDNDAYENSISDPLDI